MLSWMQFLIIHIKHGCGEAEDSGVRRKRRQHGWKVRAEAKRVKESSLMAFSRFGKVDEVRFLFVEHGLSFQGKWLFQQTITVPLPAFLNRCMTTGSASAVWGVKWGLRVWNAFLFHCLFLTRINQPVGVQWRWMCRWKNLLQPLAGFNRKYF